LNVVDNVITVDPQTEAPGFYWYNYVRPQLVIEAQFICGARLLLIRQNFSELMSAAVI